MATSSSVTVQQIQPLTPPPEQASSRARKVISSTLNTIIEEGESEVEEDEPPFAHTSLARKYRASRSFPPHPNRQYSRQQEQASADASGIAHPSPSSLDHNDDDDDDDESMDRETQIEQWLSPMSDHFPTPRGFHFLPAPIVASSTSSDQDRSASWGDRELSDDQVSIADTDGTEFDDLCELEEDTAISMSSRPPLLRNHGHGGGRVPAALPPLVIPKQGQGRRRTRGDRADGGDNVPTTAGSSPDKKSWISPVTSPSPLALSPQVIEMMERQQSLALPNISSPPSLDGSLDSDNLATLSSPPTPLLGPDDNDRRNSPPQWAGVRLEPQALATLRALRLGEGGDNDAEGEEEEELADHVPQPPSGQLPSTRVPEMRQAPLRLVTDMQPPSRSQPRTAQENSNTTTLNSAVSLTRLDIPSPATFFANLPAGTRSTWDPKSATTVDDLESVNSGTAELFYFTPWASAVGKTVDDAARRPRSTSESSAASATASATAAAQHHQPQAVSGDVVEAYRRTFGHSSPIEQVVEVSSGNDSGEDQTTAKLVRTATTAVYNPIVSPRSDCHKLPAEAVEIVLDCDPKQAREQQQAALSNLDRMEAWLAAQHAYLPSLPSSLSTDDKVEKEEEDEVECDDKEAGDDGNGQIKDNNLPRHPFHLLPTNEGKPPASPEQEQQPVESADVCETIALTEAPPAAASIVKAVRFSELPKVSHLSHRRPRHLPPALFRPESAFYRAFQEYIVRQRPSDVFVHRLPRFEALQAQRSSLRDSHRNQLLGKFQLSVVPQSTKKRLSANVARGDDELIDDPARLRRDKEHEAFAQMRLAIWDVEAIRLLNGGRLIAAPVAKRLGRVSCMAPGPDGLTRDRARILDLGGQATCGWAWHVAHQYPNTKVYTVTTKAARQMANSNIRGPPNHRHVAVERLTRLPFGDGQFDLVSARELHSILKFVGENGEDEWEGCLREVMRVLKPGGYLDFSVMDSDMMNAGPLGLAKSVELGFKLSTLGYDPTPTKNFIPRLARTGFSSVRRAWMCLPMGERPAPSKGIMAIPKTALRHSSSGYHPDIHVLTLEATVTGSSDGVASVAGLAAGLSWERWLLRCETERVASELRLQDTTTNGATVELAGRCLDGVAGAVDEGRACGAGWRMLNGWARKPWAHETEKWGGAARGANEEGVIDIILG